MLVRLHLAMACRQPTPPHSFPSIALRAENQSLRTEVQQLNRTVRTRNMPVCPACARLSLQVPLLHSSLPAKHHLTFMTAHACRV